MSGIAAAAAESATDVFLFSHGWMADLPAARRQYGAWVGAMAESAADIERLATVRPGFRPLLVGLHWPSRPWSEEEFGVASFGPDVAAPRRLLDEYAARLADTPATREALRVVISAALVDPDPVAPPAQVLDAYAVLDREAGLGAATPARIANRSTRPASCWPLATRSASAGLVSAACSPRCGFSRSGR